MVWPELVLKTGAYPGSMVTVVTGASGYIGSHVVANLLARGESVGATVRDVTDPERVTHLEVNRRGRCFGSGRDGSIQS